MTAALGIDVGGTKIAAGLVDVVDRARSSSGARCRRAPSAAARRSWATAPRSPRSSAAGVCRWGSACASSSTSTAGPRAPTRSTGATSTSAAAIEAPRVVVESDVRAAALAEARFGAGAGRLAVPLRDRRHGRERLPRRRRAPLRGRARRGDRARARRRSSASRAAAALARAAGLERAEDVLADPAHAPLVDAAAAALGSVLAVLANALDPSLIVLGGGLGAAAGVPGARRAGVPVAARVPVALPPLAVVGSLLAPDGGVDRRGPRGAFETADRVRARAGRDRPVARPDRAARRRSPRRSTTATASPRSRRCSARPACAGSSRAATAPRTTSPSRCGSPRSRDPRARGAWPCRAACSPAARSHGGRATSLLAVSSSGEFRDLIEAVDAGAPAPFAAVTATAGLDARLAGRRAGARLRGEPARGHAHAGVLRRRRRGARRLGRGHLRRRRSTPSLAPAAGASSSAPSPAPGRGSTRSGAVDARRRSCSGAAPPGRRRSRRRCC